MDTRTQREKLYEWGRIVPGVNTTPDICVDAIERFASTLMLGCDKNGRPHRSMMDRDQPALGKKMRVNDLKENTSFEEMVHKWKLAP